ncbi:ZIP family metal transporter [Microbacterium rhizophilus]|uniref:ZIP family metal transporter n=1 Tax=Microbacterium rhizophilus TaxID=3138934 RepID=UPI0031EBE728
MLESVLWGVVGAVPLVIGAVLAGLRTWPDRLVGIVLGFGAGALIASIAFELWEEGLAQGGPLPLAVGVALGAAVYFTADRLVERWARRAGGGAAAGVPLALGALLDGIPEQLVLGFGLADGAGVSVALVVAIFVSNLPESVGSSADLIEGGVRRPAVLGIWSVVAALCALATVAGWALADVATVAVRTSLNGFAAGALLVMMVDSMIPEAQRRAKDLAGIATVLGFALAAGLATL